MKLFLISQNVNDNYATCNSAIVAAISEEEARFIHPDGYIKNWNGIKKPYHDSWCDAKDVKVEYIGEAKEGTNKGLILSSFNSG